MSEEQGMANFLLAAIGFGILLIYSISKSDSELYYSKEVLADKWYVKHKNKIFAVVILCWWHPLFLLLTKAWLG